MMTMQNINNIAKHNKLNAQKTKEKQTIHRIIKIK